MNEPRRWTLDELTQDAANARASFRQWRLTETLGLYSQYVETFVPVFDRLIDQLPALTTHRLDLHMLAEVMRDENMRTAFRYLAAPPVSEDDLKTLAESNLAPSTLRERRTEAERVRDTVLRIIDPQVVPAAVIAGVFHPLNLATAQHEGLTVYWNDRLADLVEFIAATSTDHSKAAGPRESGHYCGKSRTDTPT